MTVSGDDVVAIARSWCGTPYLHQASLKGVGCDCLGLVRGIWRDLFGGEAEDMVPYSPDWGEVAQRETLLEAARRHFVEVNSRPLACGDLLIFRIRPMAIAKHAAIASAQARMIHAQERVGVCEVPLGPWWRRRIAGRFRFPGVLG